MTKTTVRCDDCGGEHESFNGEQAWGRATSRHPEKGVFVSHYGSEHDGDVMKIVKPVPETTKHLCDGCVTRMLADGTLVFESNYLGDWAGKAVGREVPA